MRLTIIFLAILCSAKIAFADDWNFAKPYLERCDLGTSNVAESACIAEQYEQVDKRLNEVYGRLTALLADSSELKKAQKAWIKFRDLDCAYRTSGMSATGSGTGRQYSACLIDVTEKRIRDIERYLEPSWDCNGCPARK